MTRSGLAVCALLLAGAGEMAFGWMLLLVPTLGALLGVAALAVGVDSRTPGDWRRAASR
jgi:peptidoglycan/LPS O-acetylase OafA/YrhL